MAPTAALVATHARLPMLLALCWACIAALAPVPVRSGSWREGPTYRPIVSVDGVKYGLASQVTSTQYSGGFLGA